MNRLDAMVAQKHARILREALARCSKMGAGSVTRICIEALQKYALAVGMTCEHPETAFVETENKDACLDCGRRILPRTHSQLELIPGGSNPPPSIL